MATIDELRAKVSARRVEGRALLDQQLLDEHARLLEALAAATIADVGENRPPEGPAIAQQVVDLEARIDAAEDVYLFEGIGTSAWYDLVALHPATERGSQQDHDWRTFRPAAVAASCIDPVLTVDDAKWLMDTMPVSEWERLWSACMQANVGADARPKSGFASTILRLNSRSSGTPQLEGSLAEPSSAVPDDPSPPTSTTTPAG